MLAGGIDVGCRCVVLAGSYTTLPNVWLGCAMAVFSVPFRLKIKECQLGHLLRY